MKHYQCHKTVHAYPMNWGAYNILRGYKLATDDDAYVEGYVVVYGYGTDDHYVSWSPKRQFEDGYTEIE